MDQQSGKKVRVFRSREIILKILKEHRKSNLSIKAFCDTNNIAAASFHNWKKKYGSGKVKLVKGAGFAALQIVSSPRVEAGLFAEVKGVRIYQRVEAAYLKQLLS